MKFNEKLESKRDRETTFQERVCDEKKSGDSYMSALSIGENAVSNGLYGGPDKKEVRNSKRGPDF